MAGVLDRVYRKLRIPLMYPTYKRYLAGLDVGHPLHGLPTRLIGDAAADPTEVIDHYDAFAYWASKRLFERGRRLKILDVGSPKMMNCVLAAAHDVTSVVLADCGDRLSSVRYVRHDVSEPFPFADHSFDAFTSTVALPLIGLGRYGDRLDAGSLVNVVGELGRVMKLTDADLFISMMLGKPILHFNNGWFLDLQTLKRIFSGWTMVDFLVDQVPLVHREAVEPGRRFNRDASIDDMKIGEGKVIFLHLRR